MKKKIVPDWAFRCVEKYLYNYDDEKQKLEEEKEDIIESSPPEFEVGGKGRSRKSDPTALKTVKMLSDPSIVEREQWLSIVADVLEDFKDTEYWGLIQKRYFEKKPPTMVYMELHIQKTTMYEWRDEIVNHGIDLAIAKGLVTYHDLRLRKVS